MVRNVILIVVDCMRSDHLGFNGYHRKLTPFMDKLASEGMNFNRAFSNGPFSPASYVSMVTSATSLDYLSYSKYPENAPNLSDVLRKNGWTTVSFNKNVWCSKFFGYGTGFDYYDDFFLGEKKAEKNIIGKIDHFLQTKLGQKSIFVRGFKYLEYLKKSFSNDIELREAGGVNERVFEWLSVNKNKKFFMWLAFMDVHPPYYPPSEHLAKVAQVSKRKKHWVNSCTSEQMSLKDRQIYQDLYDANISYMDSELEKLYLKLDKLGILKNTMIIITADHGFEFWEHDWLGMKAKMYEENIRVPLIIWNSGVRGNTDKLVTLRDLPFTISKVLDVDYKFLSNNDLLHFHGEEFVYSECAYNPLRGPIYLGEEEKYQGNIIYCIRSKRYKYIYDDGNKKEEMYDLDNDADEKDNLVLDNVGKFDKELFEFRDLLRKRKEKIYSKKESEEEILNKIQI